jgi:hypothetical protein
MAANKSFTEKKTTLETKRQQLADKLVKLEAAERERQRKHETAQRLVVGKAALAHAKKDMDFARLLFGILKTSVTRPDERRAIADLLTESEAMTAMGHEGQTATATSTATAQPEETHTASADASA